MRSEHSKLGLKLVSLEENHSRTPKKPSMAEENKNDGAYDFGGTSPFKVQVNFDIPLFEGQIDAEALDKWLNLLEDYFFVHKFSDKEKITFTLLKALPHVKH